MQRTLKEEAKEYQPSQIKNIAELENVSTDLNIHEDNEAEFPYKYIIVEGEKYKVPISVIASLKDLLEENADLKKFKVKRTGEGLKTKYTVIPLS